MSETQAKFSADQIEAGRLLFARAIRLHQGLRAHRRPATG
jgi:hypothetical protein